MSILLNLTVLPLLALAAILLLYSNIGFLIAVLIALRRTFQQLRNIFFVLFYLCGIIVVTGLCYFIMKLTMWVATLSGYKIWGYEGFCILFLFTTWKIIPQFIKVALEQTSRMNELSE
jgi:hypothetical protein